MGLDIDQETGARKDKISQTKETLHDLLLDFARLDPPSQDFVLKILTDPSQEARGLEKEARIRKEVRRLNTVFKSLDENKKKVAKALIERAAYMTVELTDLEAQIAREGCQEVYQHGENQFGVKETTAVKTHLAMTKNLSTVLKMLGDLAPAAKSKTKSRLEMLRDEED